MFGKLTSKRKILAVDWDARRLRLVYAAIGKGAVHIDRLLSVDLPAEVDVSEPQSLGAMIHQVLVQERIHPDCVVLDVPRDQTLLSTLKLPPASPEEMPAIVQFQIAHELPYPLAEAVVDYAAPNLIGATETVDVLVGTVRREVIEYYERTCTAAGLKLGRIGLRPYANTVAVNELLGDSRPEHVVFVDVGPGLTEIDVIRDGRLVFSRAASVPIPRLREAAGETRDRVDEGAASPEGGGRESIIRFPAGRSGTGEIERVLEALVVEVTRSIEAYRSSAPEAAVGRVVVGGSTGLEDRLAEALSRRYETPGDLYDPARQFGWPAERGDEARAFAAALGLVLGHAAEGRLHFDFLHPKKAVSERERQLRRAPVALIVILLLAAVGAAYYFLGVVPGRKQLAKVKSEISKIKDEAKELAKVEQVIEKAKAFEAEQVIWVDELERVIAQAPSNRDIVFTRVDMYQKGARMNLQFEARTTEAAQEMVKRIDEVTVNGSDEQYLDATLGVTTERGARDYGVTGQMSVVVRSKADNK